MKKIIFAILVIIVLAISFSFAKSFNDVDESFWAYKPINEMLEGGILTGYLDGSFKPNNAITRAEFSKILVTALGLKDVSKKSFVDVEDSFWAKDYIQISANYLSAYDAGNNKYQFYPNQHAMREDVAVALVKALKLDNSSFNINTLDTFKDKNTISANNRKYIAIAVEKNLIKGFEDGTFRPKASLTRAQVSQLIYNSNSISNNENKDLILEVGDGFKFNKEDLTLDLGENWEKYVVGLYRASQRHLMYNSESLGYQKYKTEEHKTGRDEYNMEYSNRFGYDDYPEGHIPYYDVNDKERRYMEIPVPFEITVPFEHFDHVSNWYQVSANESFEIKYSGCNKIKEALATIYINTPETGTIFRQFLNTNPNIVIPKFNKRDCVTLQIKLTDEFGNKYTNYYYLYNKELLKYKAEYYSVLSDGVFEENGATKIKLGTAMIQEIKDYTISKTCKIPDSLKYGSVYSNGVPVFVCVRINEKNEVVQIIVINNEEYLTPGLWCEDTYYYGGYVFKVNANDIDGNLNSTVYKYYDTNFEKPINTNNAVRWMCSPTVNGTEKLDASNYNRFSTFGRVYEFLYDNIDAWIVTDEYGDEYATHFMVANYNDNTHVIETVEIEEPEEEKPLENTSSSDMYQSEELVFIQEDLTINLGKNFEDYIFTSYNNTYKPSQRVLVYNGSYANGKEIKCEETSDSRKYSECSGQLLSFIGNESSKEPKNVSIKNTKTGAVTNISIPNPFRTTIKIGSQEIYSSYSDMYGDTDEKRNAINLGNEKDKVTINFDILNGLKEATITINDFKNDKIEYTTNKKTFSFKLPEFKYSDIAYLKIKIVDQKDNVEHIDYKIINKKIYELNCGFYYVNNYSISSKNTITLGKPGESGNKEYKLASYLRIPDDLKKNTEGIPMICWIGLDKSNKIGAIIPITRIRWKESDFGTYYSGPELKRIGALDAKKQVAYSIYDEDKEEPIYLYNIKSYFYKPDFDMNNLDLNAILNEIQDGLNNTFLGYFAYNDDGIIDIAFIFEYLEASSLE